MSENQYNSIYPAIVKDNKDPKFLGRVKLLVPSLSLDFTTEWAFPSSKVTGEGFGEFWPPEEDAGCWVQFLEGDPEHPVYSGGYYSEPDGTPETPTEFQRETPTNRGFKTKSGHLVEYDDLEDSQGIRITSSTGFKVVLDDKNKILCLESPDGQKFCLDDENKLVTMNATGDVVETIAKNKDVNVGENYTVTVAGDETHNANNTIINTAANEEHNTTSYTMNASGDEEHNNANFKVNSTANIEMKATGNAEFKGTAQTDLGSDASTTMVNGLIVILAGGGIPVAVVGSKAVGQGNAGSPVVSTIVQGSTRVFAPF